MTYDVLIAAASLARRFEGLYLTPYLCPAGIPTIGYGSTHYPDGTRVMLSDPPITKERAEVMLQCELQRCLMQTLKICAVLPRWGCNPTAAIVDFVFNLGIGRFGASTLRRKIMAGDADGAKQELMKWVYGGGRKLRGLELRRAAEAALLPA